MELTDLAPRRFIPATVHRHLRPGAAPTPPEATARALLSVLAVVSAVVWVIGVATGTTVVQALSATWLVVVGVGSAPWVVARGLGTLDRWALSLLVGLSLMVLVPTAAVTLGSWHPLIMLVLLAVPACVVHLHVLATGGLALLVRRGLSGLPPGGRTQRGALLRPRTRHRSLAPALAVAGASCCTAAALAHRHIEPRYFGYLREVGPGWYLGFALLLAAVVALRGDARRSGWFVATLLTAATTLTPALVYDLPRSASTGKHVALVEQILTEGHLSSVVAVYNAWPGFFAGAAWLCGVGGIRDPFQLAQWWAPALGLVRVVALGQLVRTAGASARWTWSAVVLAVLADALGADYFSPQALAFVLAVLTFGVLLRAGASRWSRDLLLLAAFATAVSHQLSPYVIAGVAVLLAAGRVVAVGEALCVIVPPLIWTGLHLGALHGFLSLADIGSFANFRPPQTTGSSGLQRSPVIAASVGSLLAGVAVIGLLGLRGLLARPWTRRWLLVAAAPAVGLALVAVNPYGNEGIFRALLFGLPWLGLLAARGLASAHRPLLWLLPALAVLAVSFPIATSALDPIYVIRAGDLHAVREVQALARQEPHRDVVLLNLGEADLPVILPTTAGGVVSLTRTSIGAPPRQSDLVPAQQAERLTTALTRYLGAGSDADAFAVWSPVSATFDAAYALETRNQSTALRDALAASPSWRVVSRQDGTVLLRMRAGVLHKVTS